MRNNIGKNIGKYLIRYSKKLLDRTKQFATAAHKTMKTPIQKTVDATDL